MPQINSTAEFNAVMTNVCRNAFIYAIEMAYKDLQEMIEKELYGTFSPTDYNRTEAIKEAWIRKASSLEAEIYFTSAMLAMDMSEGQHTSLFAEDWSLGDSLLDVLESGYKGFNAKRGKPIPPRPFFEKWMKRADKRAGKWFKEGLQMQGLKVKGRQKGTTK